MYRNVLFKLRKSIYYEEVINKLLTVISVYNRLGHRQQVFVGPLTLRHLMTCANGEIISAQYVRNVTFWTMLTKN